MAADRGLGPLDRACLGGAGRSEEEPLGARSARLCVSQMSLWPARSCVSRMGLGGPSCSIVRVSDEPWPARSCVSRMSRPPNLRSPAESPVARRTSGRPPNLRSPAESPVARRISGRPPNLRSPAGPPVARRTSGRPPDLRSPAEPPVVDRTSDHPPDFPSPADANLRSPTHLFFAVGPLPVGPSIRNAPGYGRWRSSSRIAPVASA